MYRVRKVKTKSGSIAVQVVLYSGHDTKVIKHIGSAKGENEINILKSKAHQWIEQQNGQLSLFPVQSEKVLFVDRAECILVSHQFSYQFLMRCMEECNFVNLPPLLRDLCIIRLIEPTSKLRSIELLDRYFGIKYTQRIYRLIPGLIAYKEQIEQQAYKIAKEKFKEQFYYVLYDVTTLYFESFKSDELKIEGFSKDNKSQQPQIVVGLLVTQSGFPLSYEVFPGNTFEGKTMIPIVENFISKYADTKPIVVADAAMLDQTRLQELREKKISYIVGARLANTNLELIKQINSSLERKNNAISRHNSIHGYLICDYSEKRYKKEYNDVNKLIKKAEHLVEIQSCKSRTTFDLQTRPIYHFKNEAIKSHVLICFVALIIEKYLELKTNMSLRNIKTLIWEINEIHLQDKITKEIFRFMSPTSEILNSPLAKLIKKWNLLPH